MNVHRPLESPAEESVWRDLKLPGMDVRSLLREFGPGMVLMMTGIGTSHLVTAPTAGGRFEYALLWCIPISYISKYYGFEMAFRFTNATGKSLLEAYGTAWRKWPLWYVLVATLIQCALGQAGRLIAASAVLYYLFSQSFGLEIPMAVYGAVLGLISVAVILRGSYRAVQTLTKVFAGMLFVTTVVVYLVRPAPLSAISEFFVVGAPEGSWLIIAAFLGLLPTGLDVSLQASEWGKAQKVGMGKIRERLEEMGLAAKFDPFAPRRQDLSVHLSRLPEDVREYCRRWFQIGLWDYRIGHTISFLIACVFMLLAAVWLYPSAVEGRAVMGEIGRIFTDSVGPWMMVFFMLGAFAATFSTAFNYFDGWPRVVGACCRNLFHRTASLQGTAKEDLTGEHRARWYSEYNLYRLTMIYSLLAAVLIIAGVPRPVFLVLVSSALAFFIAPVIYFLNLFFCMTVVAKEDREFYPSTFAIWFGWASFLFFTGFTVLSVMADMFEIRFFG